MGLFDRKYCSVCGEKIGLLGNRKLEDGNLCKSCAGKVGGEAVSKSALHAMQHISLASIEKLYTFVLAEPSFSELRSIILRYRHRYMDHSFNSERFLDNV